MQFYGPNVFVHNEVYYDTRSLYNTPILANLKRRVLIYYSSISLSSHAKLCPIAECDVMSSCNDEHLQNNPACCSSGDKTSLKIKKKKKKSEGMFFKTFQSTAFCSVKEFCNWVLSNVWFKYKEWTRVFPLSGVLALSHIPVLSLCVFLFVCLVCFREHICWTTQRGWKGHLGDWRLATR